MAWLWLSFAIVSEVFATMALKLSEGFTKTTPSFFVLTGYLFCFYSLSKVLQYFPVAIIYSIWSGIGIILITIASWYWFGQKLNFMEIIGIGLIIAGIVIIKSFSENI